MTPSGISGFSGRQAMVEPKFSRGDRVMYDLDAIGKINPLFKVHSSRIGTVVKERNHMVSLIWDGNKCASQYHRDLLMLKT